MPLHEWTPSQRRNEQGEIEENQKDLRTWLFEEESFVPLALFQDGKAYSIVTDHLGTPVEAYNEQAHHLIPEKVWSQNEQFLNQIGLSGQCDVSSNGLHMYNSKELAIANGKAYYHRGRHDSYSHAINRRISAIENQYHSDLQAGILSPEEARQEARQEIRKLQNRLRKVLDRDSKTNEPRRVGYKKI